MTDYERGYHQGKADAIKLIQQALNALETKGEHHPRVYQAIAALREKLAQSEPKPATYQAYGMMGGDEFVSKDSVKRMIV